MGYNNPIDKQMGLIMAKWYSEDPEYSKCSKAEFEMREKIVAIMERFTRDMEGYAYLGSNYGMPKDDYEDAAEEIIAAFGMVK